MVFIKLIGSVLSVSLTIFKRFFCSFSLPHGDTTTVVVALVLAPKASNTCSIIVILYVPLARSPAGRKDLLKKMLLLTDRKNSD